MTKSNSTVPDKWDATHIQSLRNKIAIVTGGNNGIGYVTVLELARKGANVVLACRSEARANEAINKIRAELSGVPGAGTLKFIQVDTSDLSSVNRFVADFKNTHDRLDLLINNAGVMDIPYEETVDGLEMQMAVNHLGHFALTAQLFDVLKASAPSRVVSVSSIAHRGAPKFDEKTFFLSKDKYDSMAAYGNSKIANLYFIFELARRLEAGGVTGVTAVACHPGVTVTNLIPTTMEKSGCMKRTYLKVMRSLPLFSPASMGALPTLYAATAPNVKNAEYYGPSGFQNLRGYPSLNTPSKESLSESAAQKVWEKSELLTGTPFPVRK
ncbi:hypothetical protein Poli38472_006833 [Pythium oligandrum]|uniref:Protochlorophyllide reductase n=1 Tax=Pythium oligandrum TaxID=41045 RepID=A0A8K1C5J8_PYTOL|nr:hypothetical protein Poli38472_006833 [Pythium oligandrum]|eukprot:TMW56823.1 hypothetical protein Poli38472_006833 [Pythium oligandrum]